MNDSDIANRSHYAYKSLLNLALPMAGTQLITISSGFLCMTMLAQLGSDVLAASALIFSVQMSVMVLGMSFLFALCILIGHAYGNKDYDKIGVLVQQGWLLAILIGLPIMLFLWHIGSVLIYFGQLKNISVIVQKYFYAHTWRVIPVLLSVCNQQLCYGIQKQKIDLITNMIGVLILVTTSYILIFGKFGFSALGVEGFAYGMAMQSWFYLLFTTFCFIKINDFHKFRLFKFRLHHQWIMIKDVFKVSWPITLQISGEMLSIFVCASMMGWLGLKALSAYQIVNQYVFLILIPIFALSQATGVLIGQACGEKQFHHIPSIGRASINIVIIISLIMTVILISFPTQLASAYIDVNSPDNKDILSLVKILFIAVSISIFIDSIRNILTGALRGIFDTRFPMLVGLTVIWLIGIPLSYLFAFTLQFGPVGIICGTIIAMSIGSSILLIRWQKKVSVF